MPVFKKRGIPVYNLQLHRSREDALNVRRGNIGFQFCKSCLFAFNAAFDPSLMDYRVEYESSRGHSIKFQDYLEEVYQRLNDSFKIAGKTVVEIGCGDGKFLEGLREKFEFHGYGFDPNVAAEGKLRIFTDLEFVRGITTRKVSRTRLIFSCFDISLNTSA